MEYGKLTISDAGRIAAVLNAVNRPVARVVDDTVFRGEARCVCSINGLSAFDVDVRELFLRVTGPAGVEHFWPVKDLMSEVESGYFVVDPA